MPRQLSIDPSVKYFPPSLMKKLEYCQHYPLTLVEAPSGFGKTTALEYFLQNRLPADSIRDTYNFEADEPLNIWHQLCERIGKVDGICAHRLLRLGPPNEDNLGEMGRVLLQLTCDRETYLWLDNYKRWNNECAGEFLDLLSHHGGSQLHILVSTQPLPLEQEKKLTSYGTQWRLREEDLLFQPEDVAAYFLAAGLPLEHRLVEEVQTLTGGWIMALCLQLRNYLSREEFAQGDMMDLMEQVFWNGLSHKEQEFFLKLSIFPRFTLSQAAALSGRNRSDTDRLLRNTSYFVHFDQDSQRFYPHAQLRTLLQEHFQQLDPEIQRQIYCQGGELAAMEGDRMSTLRFYYLAGEWDRLLSLSASSYEVADVVDRDIHPAIIHVLEDAPRAVKRRHPQALISLAFALFILGDQKKLLEVQGEIVEIILESDLSELEKNALQGEMELLLSFLEYNRISDMSARHRRALGLLGGPARLISPKSVWTFGSPSVLYLYWRESGKLREELEEMDQCMPIYYQLTRDHGYGAELVMRAEALLLQGEVGESLTLCYQAMFEARNHNQDSILLCGLFLLCRLAVQQGKPRELELFLEEIREISQRHAEDLNRYTRDLAESYLAVIQGKPENVSPWIANGDISDKRLMIMVQPLALVIYGRCLLAAGEFHKLLGAGEYFMGLSSIFPNLMPQVYGHIYGAQALGALGRQEEAVQRLQQALDLALPDQVYLPFAENYEGISHLLSMTTLREPELKKIRALSRVYVREPEQKDQPFTPRERSIHYLLQEQLTNREIGERLHLSPNTVRNILSSMMKKKHVTSREALRQLPEE